MKTKLLTMLLVLLPAFAQSQISQVTESQKQLALQRVSEFCSLLTQWSNGQRTLDTKIYALCSGNDCSAFDDVSTNKETTMRNYLLGIQKKYPKSLQMQISQPSLTDCKITYEPVLELTSNIRNINGYSPMGYGEMIEYSTQSYANAFIVFRVIQQMPTIGKNKEKMIVFDVNIQKITAFITGSGTFISYLDGLNLMTKRDYINAIPKFDVAASNNRSSLKKNCYTAAMTCCVYSNDFPSAIRYSKLLNDPIINKYLNTFSYFQQEKFSESLAMAEECEQLVKKGGERYSTMLSALYGLQALIYSLPNEMGHNYSIPKAVSYYKKAINAGNVQAAYLLFTFFMETDEDEILDGLITGDELIHYLEWAAEKGHPAAILLMGKTEELGQENIPKAISWYEKGANTGDTFCMACLGKLLLQKGKSYETKGKDWLRKALEGDNFEKQRKGYEGFINNDFWPNSRSDIQSLLNNFGNNLNVSTNSNPHIENSTPSTNTITQNVITSTSSTSTNNGSSYYKKRHRPFNKKWDSYVGGFTIGYIQKQWTYEDDGEKEKGGLFEDDDFYNGIQTGFRVDPQFGAGFGINSGLFYEYCWGKSDEQHDKYGSFHYTYEEHGLYAPIHLKFTMNFSRWFQLSFYAGVGFNYVFSGKLYLRDDGETYDSMDVFDDDEDWKRWNSMLEYGASIRIARVQLDFSMSKGLKDWTKDEDYKTTQGRPLNLSMTICF